jgi:hypothetical protein
MRVKRGKDRFWKVLKYQGDAAYYANCKCGYEYCCGNSVNRHNYKDWTIYMYCPCCGARKKEYNPEVIKTRIDIDEHRRKKYGG